MGKLLLAFILTFLGLVNYSYAHGEEPVPEPLGFSPLDSLIYSSLIVAVVIIISVILRGRAGENGKKLMFIAIALPVAFSTVYIGGDTIYLNLISESRGPVHWHADFEVWACGEEIHLMESSGFDNKVGSPVLHYHNDNRIHVEGVLLTLEEANLHEFFEAIGGDLSSQSITVPVHEEGLKTWTNGAFCPDGKPGKLYMFVNGELNNEYDNYIISPYSNVPPGDEIKFVFDTREASVINPILREVP